MIPLTRNIINKIDRIRFFSKLNARIRFLFIAAVIFGLWYFIDNNMYEEYSYFLIVGLVSTMTINTISDFFKSELEQALKTLEYDKNKKKYLDIL
jgi:hypothetical protein